MSKYENLTKKTVYHVNSWINGFHFHRSRYCYEQLKGWLFDINFSEISWFNQHEKKLIRKVSKLLKEEIDDF